MPAAKKVSHSATTNASNMRLSQQSKFEEARTEMQKEPELFRRKYGLALVYHGAGEKKQADAALAELMDKYQSSETSGELN